LLNDEGTTADTSARNYVSDPHADHIKAAPLAIDGLTCSPFSGRR
jgi:hypothetical protein